MSGRRLGALAAAVAIGLAGAAAAGADEWQAIATPAGAVHFLPGDEPTARMVAELLTPTRDRVAAYLGLTVWPAIDVWVAVPGREPPWMDGRGQVADWASGFAYPEQRRVVVRPQRALRGSLLDLPDLLAHEIGHVLAAELVGRGAPAMPHWFSEGLAMRVAAEPPARGLPGLLLAAAFRRLLPWSELDSSWPADRGPAELAYAQAHHFMGYIDATYGPETPGRVLRRLRGGADFEEAFRAVTGDRPAAAQAAWEAGLRHSVIWLPLATGGITLWVVLSLLVIAGWLRRRILDQETAARWDAEDASGRG